MKFLCVECDRQMTFEERQLPGDGTLAAAFKCPACGRMVAMLTNPMETQLVASLGVQIGGRSVPAQPLETVGAVAEYERQMSLGFDLVVAVGTSASFPYIAQPVLTARLQGLRTVEINPGTTRLSGLVELRLPYSASVALDAIEARRVRSG